MRETETSQPEFNSVTDIGHRLGVTTDTVLAYIKSGELVAVDVSRGRGERPRWRISESDLLGFLQRRRTASPAPKPERRKRPAVLIPRHV